MISIILPSVGRPEQLKKTVLRLKETAPEAEIVCVVDDDSASKDTVARLADITVFGDRNGPIAAWNVGAACSHGDIFVAASDDFNWHEQWLTNALIALDEIGGDGMVGFNDLAQDGNILATNFLVTRKYAVDYWGGVIYCPHYKGFYCDTEATRRAQRDGKYIWAVNAITEHLHWANHKAVKDATYRARDGFWAHDEALFLKRQAEGFKNDYEAAFSYRPD